MPASDQPPVPPRRLLLEDEWLIAFDLQEMLETAGYVVVGPAASVDAALALDRAERQPIQAGLFDLHVAHETSYPVARELKSRGIPFAFLTGHNREDLEPEFRPHPVICKPASAAELSRRVSALLAPSP